MKTGIRITTLLLALLTAVTCFAGCGETTKEEDTAAVAATTVAENTEAAETAYNALDHIQSGDLNKSTFAMLTPIHDWAITNLTGEEVTGDVIQDAIYARQLQVESLLNCTLMEKAVSSVITTIKTVSGNSGDDAYGLGLCPAYDALALYRDGYIVDQAKLETIDLSNPWWEESFNAQVNMGELRYITFSQASLIYYSSFYIFCFNKQMIEDNSLENPYDLVKNGEWTWDKAYEMMKTAAVDVGSDGVFVPGTDTLGLTGHINHARNIRFSSGFTVCEDTENGGLKYDGLSQNFVDAFTKYSEYFINSAYVAISGGPGSKYNSYAGESGVKNYVSVFKEGKSLFLTTGTNEVMQIRDAETEYGIVCVPKYSKDQENYITPVYSATAGFVIPKVGGDTFISNAGLVLEALGACSYANLVDKHIGIVLHSRCAQDATAVEMINLAYESGAVDKAMANNFGSCTTIMNNLDVAGMTNVGTLFTSIKKKLNSDIAAAMEIADID